MSLSSALLAEPDRFYFSLSTSDSSFLSLSLFRLNAFFFVSLNPIFPYTASLVALFSSTLPFALSLSLSFVYRIFNVHCRLTRIDQPLIMVGLRSTLWTIVIHPSILATKPCADDIQANSQSRSSRATSEYDCPVINVMLETGQENKKRRHPRDYPTQNRRRNASREREEKESHPERNKKREEKSCMRVIETRQMTLEGLIDPTLVILIVYSERNFWAQMVREHNTISTPLCETYQSPPTSLLPSTPRLLPFVSKTRFHPALLPPSPGVTA